MEMKPVSSVYVVGVGAIGGLVGHELNLAHNGTVNVGLLFKNAKTLGAFKGSCNSSIIVNRVQNDITSTSTSEIKGYTADSLRKTWNISPTAAPEGLNSSGGKIQNLVVSTKAFLTVGALSPYLDLLDNNSNILFIHNGMGVIDECVDRLWPLVAQRPNIFKAVVTHGAYKTSLNVINHVGLGSMKVSYIPQNSDQLNQPMGIGLCPDMIKMILNTPTLNARYLDYHQFSMAEIEKLAVNACVNPLTAVLDCLNGDLLYGSKVIKIMRKVIDELIKVVRAEYSGVIENVPEANTRLEQKRLLDIVLEVIQTTAKNSSSMREDVRNLKTTEIDYINGYISRLGEKHSIPTVTNNMLISMVKTKLTIEKSIDASAVDTVLEQM